MTELSPAARRTLEARAQALAQPLEDATEATATLDLLLFSCAGAAYAVEASDVVAVVPLGDTTPVPGTPPAVLGVVNHRGRILAVVDVERLVGAAEATSQSRLGIVVATDRASFVLVADTVPELASLDERDVTLTTRADGTVRGVTGGMAAVLDVDALARDPRIAVDDEVE